MNIGFINLKTLTGDWFAIDNFTLTYYGLQDETRHTPTDKYGTVCLPFSAQVEGAKLYTLTLSEEQDAVVLTPLEGEMEAGQPYVYKATADLQTFSYSVGPVVLKPVYDEWLNGVFVPTTVPVGDYVMQTQEAGQKFYKVVAGEQPTLSPYKAYLTLHAESAVKALRIDSADEQSEETAIRSLDPLLTGQTPIYDINGRKLPSLQKGLNIVGGMKVLVK